MRTPTWVLGYHGCDRAVGEAVLAGKTVLRVSENTSFTFNGTVSDGSVVFLPNSNAQSISLSGVKPTTGAIKGFADFGVFSPPTGSGSARIFMDFAMTRVGN